MCGTEIGETHFMNNQNGDTGFQTNRGSLLQLTPTTGLVVTGSGPGYNTWNISQSVSFRKYSMDGIQQTKHKDSKFESLAFISSMLMFRKWWAQIYASIHALYIY